MSETATLSTYLPPETFEHIIFFIDDFTTLKTVCLSSNVFVLPAQARLFSHLNLTKTPPDIIQFLTSSPHISRHIRSIVVLKEDPALPVLLEALAQTAKLKELTLVGDYNVNPWPTVLLRVLMWKILPFLSSFTIDMISAPLFLVTSCTRLRCVQAYASDLHMERDKKFPDLFRTDEDALKQLGIIPSSLECEPMLFLTVLALDGTHNTIDRTCPLVELVQRGKFPALKGLDLSRNDAEWFPLQDIAKLVTPLMNQLVCLDVGYWPQWDYYGSSCIDSLALSSLIRVFLDRNDEDHTQDLDFFQIHYYPHLQFFSTRLQQKRNLNQNEEYIRISSHLQWIMDSVRRLPSPHPLKILRIQLAAEWCEGVGVNNKDGLEGERQLAGAIWETLVFELTQNPHLERLERMVIPIHPEFPRMKQALEDRLMTLNVDGKLSFEFTDVGKYFESLTQS
ncbi:hypothetical protein DL96DRAFT_1715342 [Flagelloscypha sp. PMI_526]|nr:hypothetical protein DL96DRAFT_1715342 [Flagelloscypha sp. PMI_526]